MNLASRSPQPAKFVALGLLRAYKWALSPMFPPACRFVPTCSDYAAEAVERYGAWRGGWISLRRLLRCHPLARAGYDPVPQPSFQVKSASHLHTQAQDHRQSMHPCGAVAPGRN